MSNDSVRRVETTHIDEQGRKAASTIQWFAEKRAATHPITHNNRLKLFVCGEEGFADIATQIETAKETIDLICWGFDPGMELKRGASPTWPRGKTYGDLLIEAAARGVRVRLLVWFDRLFCKFAKNMPGYSHDTSPWRKRGRYHGGENFSALHSLATLKAEVKHLSGCITPDMIPGVAREEYCFSWYDSAMHGLLSGIEVRTRGTDNDNVTRSLDAERHQPRH